MTQCKFTVNGSSVIGNLTWNTNASLRQLAISDPFTAGNSQVCNYKYDDLARLGTTDCGTVFAQAYNYDAFGNIAKAGTISFQPTYNPATNRYSTLPAGTPAYDANGFVNADGFHVYSYDVEGKIAQIDSGGVVMTYDALGRWVEKLSGGNYIQGVYDPRGDELALMFNGTALAEARTPLVDGSAVRYTSGGLDSYFHPDWLGSTRFKSTPGRTVKDDVAFAPFGEQYVTSGPVDSFFTVAPHDMEVDLRDFPAREYHMTQGRWLTPDPAGLEAVDLSNPQTLNRYGYVMNDPLANVDPTGMDACFTYYTVNNGDGPTFIASTTCYTTIPKGEDPQQPTYGNRGGTQTGGSGPGQPPKSGNVFSCASEFAGKYSIAGGLQRFGIGTKGVGGFVTNALGGNAFSGATDLIQSFGSGEAGGHNVFYNMGQGVAAGPTSQIHFRKHDHEVAGQRSISCWPFVRSKSTRCQQARDTASA